MKNLFFPIAAILLLSYSPADPSLSQKERKFAIDLLTRSKKQLLGAIEGLSEGQLNFKAAPDSWSIAECTEHIAITEGSLFGMVESALKQPADPSRRSEVKMTDDQVLEVITDRSNKVKTREAFKPTGRFESQAEAVKDFVSKRDSHLGYIKNTRDDLRNRYQELRFGVIDAYQVVLFMAGHTERHTKQIEEVKGNPDFPKK